jgi:hypothetical protein
VLIHVERHSWVQPALKLAGDVAVEVSDLPLALALVDDELNTGRRVSGEQ